MAADRARVTLPRSNEVGILYLLSGSANPDDIALYAAWAFAYLQTWLIRDAVPRNLPPEAHCAS
jgi:hypothetical protein